MTQTGAPSSSAGFFSRLRRATRNVWLPGSRFARTLIARADEARDDGRHLEAAVLYREALRLVPRRAELAIQAGHMFKEARDFATAERFYRAAERERPDDADLQHQLGHFYKTIDRIAEAEIRYQRAAELAENWQEPRAELQALRRRHIAPTIAAAEALIPELVARPVALEKDYRLDEVVLHNLGGRSIPGPDGRLPVLAGVESFRGVCFSDRVVTDAAVYLNGRLLHKEAITTLPTENPGIGKAVFNIWADLSATEPGAYRLEVVLNDANGMTRRHVQPVLVAEPFKNTEVARAADSIVFLESDDDRDLEVRVRTAPSVMRAVARRLPAIPQSILVLRTDQLGDIVVSLPAVRRLRLHFPKAKLVGLLTEANVGLARALDLFDEIIVIDFPDDMERRQRTMSPDDQRDLQTRLLGYRFDVAIDLATSNMSRSLLKLAGATLTFGFDDDNSPWVDGGITGNVRDPRGRGEMSPQSGRIVALVDRVATLFDTGATIVPNANAAYPRLAALGLVERDRYVVLHLGARIAFSRWSLYPELARQLFARQDVKIVVLGSEVDMRAALADVPNVAERLIVIEQRLAFDDLDLLLSNAALFIGNDSGPKHLAALRGTLVVSIHCARISWAEWAQEQTGIVISRRVPCAGCAIFHDCDHCAKDFACVTDIRVEEVLGAAEALLAPASTTLAG